MTPRWSTPPTWVELASWDAGHGIAADALGDAYVTGLADSSDFPVSPGAFQTTPGAGDAFVSKFNAGGSALLYST